MNKVLLGTTALVSLAAGVAMADGLHVMLGGNIESQVGTVDQESGYDIVAVGTASSPSAAAVTGSVVVPGTLGTDFVRAHETNINNAADMFVSVSHKADNGLVYGGFAGFGTHAKFNRDNAPQLRRTFLWAENNMGHLEFGSNYSVDAMMKHDAAKIARASGGINGDWFEYANVNLAMATNTGGRAAQGGIGGNGGTAGLAPLAALSNAATTGNTFDYFVVSPNFLTTAANENAVEDSRKISYISPRYSGFQFGVSFTPDTGNNGANASAIGTIAGGADGATSPGGINDAKNVWTAGLNYKGRVERFDVGASLLGNFGRSDNALFRKLREYQVGAQAGWNSWTVAASYMDSGKSMMQKVALSPAVKGSHTWTMGGAYVNGPVGASLTYLNSRVNRNKFANISLGADYALARGLMPYAEVTMFNLKPNKSLTTVNKNSGTVVILGTALTF